MSSEVEETLKRINSHKGVKGVLIMNSEGTSHVPHFICVFPLAKTAVIMRLSIPYTFGVIEAPTAPDRIILLACKH